MKINKYKIVGMSCNGCKTHATEILEKFKDIHHVEIDLSSGEAVVESTDKLSLKKLKKAFKEDGDLYQIYGENEKIVKKEKNTTFIENALYYCPMQCEGDKTYQQPGDCPICGMDLVVDQSSIQRGEDTILKDLIFKLRLSIAFTGIIFIIAMSDMIPNNPLYQWISPFYWNILQLLLSIPVVFYTTKQFFVRAFKSIKTMNLNMFTLVGIGSGVAWIYSLVALFFPTYFPLQMKNHHGMVHLYFEATTVILTLVLFGQYLEAKAHKKTTQAIQALLELTPETTLKITKNKTTEIPVKEVVINDLLLIKPGSKIPVDGIVYTGNAVIDESMITGESLPVDKNVGMAVFAGTINQFTAFEMKVSKVGEETLLSQIIQMVNKASKSQAPIQKLADKISSYFVPLVMLVSLLTFILWFWLGPTPKITYALVNAIAVLIIACPCALGLATPMSIMVGVGKGASLGILIKNATALENMNKIDTILFDKTGTLTEGKPTVVHLELADLNKTFLSYIYSLNLLSEHPLAKATVEYLKAQDTVKQIEVLNFTSMVGKGVYGEIDQHICEIVNENVIKNAGIYLKNEILKKVKKLQSTGVTISYIVINKQLVGFIGFSDSIKENTIEMVQKFKKNNIEVIMITGDHNNTAKVIANQVGITNYIAEVLPEDKFNYIKKLQAAGKLVAMVGDGINDAPALMQSNIGIAMGNGTQIAMESADITILKGDIRKIYQTYQLSKKTFTNIKQNLFFAMAYNTLGIPVAAGLLYPIFGLLLSPMIAALAMSFSSVSVITNSLRLKNTKL